MHLKIVCVQYDKKQVDNKTTCTLLEAYLYFCLSKMKKIDIWMITLKEFILLNIVLSDCLYCNHLSIGS